MRRKAFIGLATACMMAVSVSGCASSTAGSQAQTTTSSETEEKTTAAETAKPEETTEGEATTEAIESTEKPVDSEYGLTTEQQGKDVPEVGSKYDDGYTLVWQDNFDSNKLNQDDWNFEFHEPGWVNNELQSYGSNSDNTFIKDGALVIQPLKIENADGTVSYTSGRVNTQNKHDFKYGKFEIRAKVPAGQGFLPAIWMMPTNENLYGQWPKCGEIDIMEVLGHQTKKLYSTLHYGEPHAEGQGSYELGLGHSFANEYHVFGLEWEPGLMNFYIDGMRYHTENDWFTKRQGFGEVTFPAPYDQPFYLILNVAVGGNWPGNPDDSTIFDERAQMCVDYVRVYQKDSYDENVSKPEKVVKFREPDETGNYILNGSFEDDSKWTFLKAGSGKGEVEIKDNAINFLIENGGDLDYSIQLVQPDVPMVKGSKYKLSFDAAADEDRTIIAAITAPNNGWVRYFKDTYVDITTEMKTYTFEFNMTGDTDAYARMEFNLGNQGSDANVKITNVRLEVTEEGDSSSAATCLPDGNYVYNGEFQEGPGRMDYWTVETASDDVATCVTNENNVREFKAVMPAGVELGDVKLVQKDMGIAGNTEYILQFAAYAEKECQIKVTVAGQEFTADLTTEKKVFSYKLTTDMELADKDICFEIGNEGTICIDDVRLQEDSLLINGSFDSGLVGYEIYAYTTTDVDYVVDTLNEDSAICIDIKNTGDLDWKIQLKQNGICLEEGATYKLTFDAKSTMDRAIMFALQRDGSADDDWTPYSDSHIAELSSEFKTFEVEFTMNFKTDENTILSISMGAVQDKQIKDLHTVIIDNITLEKK